jgi:flagellar basal body-associated protein FliL
VDIIGIIETLGIPVAVALGLGYALMYLIKFITKDVTADIKNLYSITVKLIDSNREAKDEVKKTMTAVSVIKDIIIKLFKKEKDGTNNS